MTKNLCLIQCCYADNQPISIVFLSWSVFKIFIIMLSSALEDMEKVGWGFF